MAKVIINKKEDFEKMFRHFKMQCKKEAILKEYKDKQQYTKPSERKRMKEGKVR